MGNVSGKRKLRVYIKPRDPDAAKAAEEAIKQEKKANLIADIEKTIGVWGEYQGVENENNKYNDIQQVLMQKAEQFQQISQQIIGEGRRATYEYGFDNKVVDEFYVIETLYKILFCLYNLETMKTNIKNLQELNANIEGENLTDILTRLGVAPMDDIVKRAGEINTYYKNILSIVKENEELVHIITDSFNIYDTDTGTEYDKQIALHNLYSEMATSKNKYKPGYHYLSAKHGQLDKMKAFLAQSLPDIQKQGGEGVKRKLLDGVPSESNKIQRGSIEGDIHKSNKIQKETVNKVSVKNSKLDILMKKYADTREKIDIITEIMIEQEKTKITELVAHIENIVDGEEQEVEYDIIIPDRAEAVVDAMAVEGAEAVVDPMEEEEEGADDMAVDPAVVDNYKIRREAIEQEDADDMAVADPDKLWLFEISDILNSIDDYNVVERIFSDVEGRLAPQPQQAALPPPGAADAQAALPPPPGAALPPLPQGVLATGQGGGKPKKKKTSLKKKKSSKNQTKSKKKKTKLMQIKKRKQTKKKRRN